MPGLTSGRLIPGQSLQVTAMLYRKISDYGIIGDMVTVALVSREGSIDWMCLPFLDSPSVFGALLDAEKGGRFSLQPLGAFDSTAAYIPDTNVLQTRFRTRDGEMVLTDFMPATREDDFGDDVSQTALYRVVEVTRGTIDVSLQFSPRFDYARAGTSISVAEGGVKAQGAGLTLDLLCSREVEAAGGSASAAWRLAAGDKVRLCLSQQGNPVGCVEAEHVERLLAQTVDYWESWLLKSETGQFTFFGPYHGLVSRSALVLKLLSYSPTGAIAAAATTSLPEEIGGGRNWDYRYTWVRDTSFTLQALYRLGHLAETEGYLNWIEQLLDSTGGAEKLQIMYGLRGQTELPEMELDHLDGYKGSRPVRIGNGAAEQTQLDIYGEMMDAALILSGYAGKIDESLWPMLQDICDHVVAHWRDADYGIWEVRGGPWHFVYSKVMCWVALDRGLKIAGRYNFPCDRKLWREARQAIRDEVLDKGYSREKQAFVQHYDTDALDASNLLIPLVGFLPGDDPRVVSTIEATRRELEHDGFIYRYLADDGLEGGEGTFLLCTFWLIDCLIMQGKLDQAEAMIRRTEAAVNHLGLFAEEYDVVWNEPLGNFPQAFTHIGYVNSVVRLLEAKHRRPVRTDSAAWPHYFSRFFAPRIILNDQEPINRIPPQETPDLLNETLNQLIGAFFDHYQDRVAYERIKDSELYVWFRELSYQLRTFDPNRLKTSHERIAFWLNIHNVMAIHGVIELGIRESIQEDRSFFRRVKYIIGGMRFCLDDIANGILRNNQRRMKGWRRMFGPADPRRRLVLGEIDPRIHFGLSCATHSSPPIASFSAKTLDRDLDLAARTYLGGGRVSLSVAERTVRLPAVFGWYGQDFGADRAEIIRFAARYVSGDGKRQYLLDHADRLKVVYDEYNWSLNSTLD